MLSRCMAQFLSPLADFSVQFRPHSILYDRLERFSKLLSFSVVCDGFLASPKVLRSSEKAIHEYGKIFLSF